MSFLVYNTFAEAVSIIILFRVGGFSLIDRSDELYRVLTVLNKRLCTFKLDRSSVGRVSLWPGVGLLHQQYMTSPLAALLTIVSMWLYTFKIMHVDLVFVQVVCVYSLPPLFGVDDVIFGV